MTATKQVSDEEAADANQRNRAISSSAISRAMSDANAGEIVVDITHMYSVHVHIDFFVY